MKYPRYPKYKDSGVEWLGEVPEGWEMCKCYNHFKAEKGRNAAQLTKEYCALNEGHFPVYSGQTEKNGIMGYINSYEFDTGNSAFLLTTTVGAKTMSLAYLQGKFSLSQNCMAILPKDEKCDSRFYFFHFQPLFEYYRQMIPDHMQPSFRMVDFYSYYIALPSHTEQQTIAAFLDGETAKIDALIAEQEKLVTLLKEKRQAVISHAATKGLNPDSPTKDSGVEWLGEVPVGWEVISLFGVAKERRQPNRGMIEQNLLSLSYGKIIRKDIDSSDGLLPESFETYQVVEKDDIIFRLTDLQNDKKSLRTGIVRERGIITSAYTSVVPIKIHAEYFAYLLRAYDTGKVFYAMGGGLRQTLKYCDAKWLPILLPRTHEQQAIVEYLDTETAKIDTLITESQKAIALLKERRSALISAAVTGKIDVRDIPLQEAI